MTRASFIAAIFFAAIALCLGSAVATAQSAGPPADYKINADYTTTSSDKKTTVEQYKKTLPDDDLTWQFWARRADTSTLLAPEQPDYPAGFRFTNDSQWLVRMQKTGSGEQSLYLYKLGPKGFVSATTKPLDALAWAYFYSQPTSRKVMKPDFHFQVDLLDGTDSNYRDLGVNWPENRYIALTLWGAVLPNGRHHQIDSVRDWRCRYELQTGKFDVPPEFAAHNKKALAPEK